MQTDSKNRQFHTGSKAPVIDEPQPDQQDLHRCEDPAGGAEVITEQKEKREAVGVVSDCLQLNIREEPNPEARILTVVTALTELVVDMTSSDEGFYKVCVDGVQGFCMKKFITLHR